MNFEITVPTNREIYGWPTTPISDYAIACGASCESTYTDPRHNRPDQQNGAIWLRDTSPSNPSVGETSRYDSVHVRLGAGGTSARLASSRNVCLCPRLMSPSRSSFHTIEIDPIPASAKKLILTFRGKPVLYPQTVCTPPEKLLQEIARPRTHIEPAFFFTHEQYKHPVYEFGNSAYCNIDYAKNFINDNKPAYFNFDGKKQIECEEGESYWFKLDPIEVRRTEDGAIQCEGGLVPHPFHSQIDFEAEMSKIKTDPRIIDTSKFNIGQYLNKRFFEEIIKSTKLGSIDYHQISQGKFTKGAPRLKTFKIGEQIHLKYEGRDGIFRGFDPSGHARVTVDGRTNLYRQEDLK